MLRSYLDRLWARGRSAYWTARLRWDAYLAGGNLTLDPTLRLRTRVIFFGNGTLRISPGVVLGDQQAGKPGRPILLSPRTELARIVLGPRVRITNGTELIALERIEAGADAMIGAGVVLLDADFHGIRPGERLNPGRSAPVILGDRVWLGMGATVLKGVKIGDDSIVGAGAVVVTDVPDGVVAVGNPARVVAGVEKEKRGAMAR
jgi:acetyltransferase-like isoleucine patch superfamily enzyme